LLTTTDGRGHTLAYSYDPIGRKTGEYDGSTTGPQLAGWTYDTLAKGQPTSSTRYAGGNAYTATVTGHHPLYRPTPTPLTIPPSQRSPARRHLHHQQHLQPRRQPVHGHPARHRRPPPRDPRLHLHRPRTTGHPRRPRHIPHPGRLHTARRTSRAHHVHRRPDRP